MTDTETGSLAKEMHEAAVVDGDGFAFDEADMLLLKGAARIRADAEVIKAAEANVARLREALDKALERLEASAFTNAEHAQAAEILRAALRDKGSG